MLVVLNRGVAQAAVRAICELVQVRGLPAVPVEFSAGTVVVIPARQVPGELVEKLHAVPGVCRIVEDRTDYPLADRQLRPQGSRVPLRGAEIGPQGFAVLVDAGEFSLDLLGLVDAAVQAGAVAVVFSLPAAETSASRAALQRVQGLRQAGGPAVGVEIGSQAELALASDRVDFFRIPAERMQDFRLLRAVGRQPKPVLLDRGRSATLDEFLLAAEYILSGGNDRVLLCEHGIRSFDPATGRATLDLAGAVRLTELTHLPVLVNPGAVGLGGEGFERVARMAAVAGLQGAVLPVSSDGVRPGTIASARLRPLLASLAVLLDIEQRPLVIPSGMVLEASSGGGWRGGTPPPFPEVGAPTKSG